MAFCGSVLTLLLGWLVTFVTGCLKMDAVCRTGRDVFRSGLPYERQNILDYPDEKLRIADQLLVFGAGRPIALIGFKGSPFTQRSFLRLYHFAAINLEY